MKEEETQRDVRKERRREMVGMRDAERWKEKELQRYGRKERCREVDRTIDAWR